MSFVRVRTLRAVTLLSVAAALPVLATCGDEDGGSETKKLEIEATGSGRNIELKAPKTVEGGVVEISFKNSANDPQEAGLIKVEGDHTTREVIQVISREGGPIPSWISGGGGVGQTKPGQTRTATQSLSAGKYVIYDTNVENGPPATADLTVEGGNGGDFPETDATVTASEYTFETSGLKAGRNEVTFENTGKELHHVIALPLRKGKTIDDVRQAFQQEGEPSGPPPFDEENSDGSAVIDGGEKQVIDLQLKSGKYVFACFIQDRKGGPPHAVKGMVTEGEI